MNKWFYLNFLLLLLAGWKFFSNPQFPIIRVSVLFGFLGFILLLFNWTRHAFYSTIRLAKDRQKKIAYANVSKKARPFHRWTGTIALLIVSVHMVLVMNRMNFNFNGIKAWSGLLTLLVVLSLVVSGWLRLFWPSGPKRLIHLYLGISLFFLLIIHLMV